MKSLSLLTLSVLMITGVSLAQYPPSGGSVGIYFDAAGTQTQSFGFPPLALKDAWVIVFWEASVGGASYCIDPPPPGLQVVVEEFPGGINIGTAWDGCGAEVGLMMPQIGFNHNPVVISHLALLNVSDAGLGFSLCVCPHCNYDTVVVADGGAAIFTADGQCGVVAAETASWGAVKSLYR